MEIESLEGIQEMRGTIDKIKENIICEDYIDRTLFEIYDFCIDHLYHIILAGVDADQLYKEQAALFDEIILVRKILYWKYSTKI
jgi:hypothetical protein